VTIGPAPKEGIERMNTVVVREQEQEIGAPRRDPYAMEMDRGRNCYICRGLGHMVHHCRNWGQKGRVAEGRRLEYGRGGVKRNLEHSDNLKGVENLDSYIKFNVLATGINADMLKSEKIEKKMEIRKIEGKILRKVTVKIMLERIDMQEGITVEALLDSRATGLVMSSEFVRKQGFKLKKLERPINIRNVDGLLNKEEPIEHTVEANIYYQGHRKRTEIDVIGGQK